MADQFLAEIRIFPFNFPPTGWATCDGQVLNISQNTALFSLLGTTYGGDGKTTFALPDLQGASPIAPGQGPGLSLRDLGEDGGQAAVTLTEAEMPLHSHFIRASNDLAVAREPSGRVLARGDGVAMYDTDTTALTPMAPQTLSPAGGGLPHNNRQPFLTLQFCIALQGIFPSRK